MVDNKHSNEICNINKNLEAIRETLKDIQQMLNKHEEQLKMCEKKTESTNANFNKKCQTCACLPPNMNVVECNTIRPSKEKKANNFPNDNSREYHTYLAMLPFQYQRHNDFMPLSWFTSLKSLPPPPFTCPVLKTFSQFPKKKDSFREASKCDNLAKAKNSLDEADLESEIEIHNRNNKIESSDALSHIDELKRMLESKRLLNSAKTSTGKVLDKNEKSLSK